MKRNELLHNQNLLEILHCAELQCVISNDKTKISRWGWLVLACAVGMVIVCTILVQLPETEGTGKMNVLSTIISEWTSYE